MTDSQLVESLGELQAEVDSLPRLEKTNVTLLTLADRVQSKRQLAGSERVWEEILCYFLDPSASHGIDDDVLRYFLAALVEGGGLEEIPTWRRGELDVDTEVPLDEGYVDLVIRDSGRWFICIELKVWSSEEPRQTVKYSNSTTLGDEKVSVYDENYFVYLTRRDGDYPESEDFKRVTWATVVKYLRRAVVEPSNNQSISGHGQVLEFTETIKQQLNIQMGPKEEDPIRKRMEIYNDYRDEIETLERAFDKFCNREKDRWQERFKSKFEDWPKDWYLRTDGNEGQIYHVDWVIHPDGAKEIEVSPLVHFEFKFDSNDLRKGQLEFIISISGRSSPAGIPGDEQWNEKLCEIYEESDEFMDALPEGCSLMTRHGGSYVASKTYDGIKPEREFYSTLKDAFNEHLEVEKIMGDIVGDHVPTTRNE